MIKWDEEKRKAIYAHFGINCPPVANSRLSFSPSGKVYFNFRIDGVRPKPLTAEESQAILDKHKATQDGNLISVFAVSIREGLKLGYSDKEKADYFQVFKGAIGSYKWLADFSDANDAVNYATLKGGKVCVYF